MKKVRKALIPAAGLGTRFLPVTHAVPKEMLPIVEEPILLHNMREIAAAGIEDVVIIAGRRKSAIEDFFDRNVELEKILEQKGNTEMLKTLEDIRNMVNVISIRQKEALGLGHAVYIGHPVIGDEPFAVLLGDELMIPEKANSPSATKQLVQTYENQNTSTVAIMEVPKEDVTKYGIIDGEKMGDVIKVRSVIEKPSVEAAPSNWALPGRYVFDSKIFSYLKDLPPGRNGEIQLTDAMEQLAQKDGLLAQFVEGKRYDAGDKLGYLIANIEMGLKHPQIGDNLKRYLKTLSKDL